MDRTALIVEHNSTDIAIYKQILSNNRNRFDQIDICRSFSEAGAYLRKKSPSCCLISYNLPDGDSTTLLDLLTTTDGLLASPVVFLIDQDDRKVAVGHLRRIDQEEYLIKNKFSAPELLNTLDAAMKAFEQRKYRYQFAKNRDSLTGLLNGDAFVRRLKNSMKRINEEKRKSFCLNYIDICKFGLINERFGRNAGDKVLKIVSERLKSHAQEPNCISRWGGDKFIVMLPVNYGEDAENSAKGLKSLFHHPVSFGQRVVYLDASIGVSQYSGENEPQSPPNDLIGQADIALQKAKSQNSGDCVIFDSAMVD